MPGEYFIGSFATEATYDLPTSIGESIEKMPRFNKMSGRYRRIHGSLVRNLNELQKSAPRDGANMDIRPRNINYEKMLEGYDKLGHMKKLSVPFDMSKSKARDMTMLMQTDAYKNILYDNYRMQCEELVASERGYTSGKSKRSLHKRGQSMRMSTASAKSGR